MLTPLPQRLSGNNDDRETIRTIVFSLADIEATTMSEYRFALPVEAVIRSIPYPTNKPVLKEGIGMINIGEQTITIVDLRHKFTSIAEGRSLTNDRKTDASKFLILFNTHAGELCGLPVKDAPSLLDLPFTTIRPLPIAYRQVNQLSFASHIAIVPQGEDLEPSQILLLGMERMLGQSFDANNHHLN
jgi:chemotaxis signal transduction protein